jgi:cytoskeleton protein RodZ
MAFFETTGVRAADGSEASAVLAEEAVEAAPSAINDTAASAQAAPFPESLAQRLIAARDARGWSQAQVASKLRLPLHIVQWIEAEQYERIGQGVYLRGYLANYARLVGVPAIAIEAVLRTKAAPPPELVATGQISHSRYLVERYSGSALYLVLTGVIFVPLVMFAMNMGGDVGSRLTPLDAPVTASLPIPGDVAAAPAQSTAAAPAGDTQTSAPATSSATPGHDSPLMASFAVVPSAPAATDSAKPAATVAATSQLRLSLAEASWVEIVDVDGRRLEYSTLAAGTVKEYTADKSVTILLGNTGGAKIEIDGHAQDITPYNRGNVARFKLAAGSKAIAAATAESHNG